MKNFAFPGLPGLPVAAILVVLAGAGPPAMRADLVGHWTFEGGSLDDAVGNFAPLVLEGDAVVEDGALDVNGIGTESFGWAHAAALPGSPAIADKTLVSWITLESLSDTTVAGAAMSIDLQVGDRFDGIVFAERNANRWMNGSSGFARTPAEQFDQVLVSEETVAPSPSIVQLAISYEDLGGGLVRITGYRNGELMGTYDSPNFATWAPGEYEILFGPRHSNPGPIGALDARIHEARLYDAALTQSEVQALVAVSSEDSDDDELPDQWEIAAVGNLGDLDGTANGPGPGSGTGDLDGDGLLDRAEFDLRSNPNNPDSDGDTLTDGDEVGGAGARPPTSPVRADTDGDGLSDLAETDDGTFDGVEDTGTDPTVADTDGDGYGDGLEVIEFGSSPLSGDEPTFAQTLMGHWTFEAGVERLDLTGRFPDVVLEGDAAIVNGALDVNGLGTVASGWARTGAGGLPIGDKTLVAWTTLESLEDVAKTGAPMSLDSVRVDKFDGIVFAERNFNRWMNGSSGFARTPAEQFDQVAVSEETETGNPIMLAITYEHLGDGFVRITGYRDGIVMGQYEIGNFATWSAGEQEVLFGPRHTSPAPIGALDALIHEARLYAMAATPDEIEALVLAGPVVGTDLDADDLADAWELEFADELETLNGKGGGPGPGAGTGDFDGDGLLDLAEQARGTDPTNPDTDGDTLLDSAEVAGAGARPPTSPTKADTDGDGLSDLVETNTGTFAGPEDTGTNPTVADTDGDGFSDGVEVVSLGSNPLNAADPGLQGALIGHWTFEAGSELKDLTGNFPDLILEGSATVGDGALDVDGEGTTSTGWARTGPGGLAVANKTLASWITLESLEDVAKAGSAMSLDSSVVDKFDGIIFAERNFNRWMNGSSNFSRSPAEQFDVVDVAEEFEPTPAGEQIMLAITYQDLGGGQVRITGYRNGEVMGSYESGAFATWSAGEQEVLFGARHTSPNPVGALDALIHEARLYGRAATASEIMAMFDSGPSGGEAFAITDIVLDRAAGTVDVTWTSRTGRTYRLEYSDDLELWFEEDDSYPLGGATGPRTTYTFVGIPPGTRTRFFRVIEE